MRTRPTYVYRLDVTYPPRSRKWQPDFDHYWQPEGWGAAERSQWAKYREDLAAFKAAGGDPTGAFGSPVRPNFDEFPAWHDWPAVRLYMSRSGASARAALLRSFGATVEIVRSKAVEW